MKPDISCAPALAPAALLSVLLGPHGPIQRPSRAPWPWRIQGGWLWGSGNSTSSEPRSCADAVVGCTAGLVPTPDTGVFSQFPALQALPLSSAWQHRFPRSEPNPALSSPSQSQALTWSSGPSWALLSPSGCPETRQLQACQGGCLSPATQLLPMAQLVSEMPPWEPWFTSPVLVPRF